MADRDPVAFDASDTAECHHIWQRAIERAREGYASRLTYGPEIMLEEAANLLAVARIIAGVACNACLGRGVQTYGSTATWGGGIGGQAMTEGVCDTCWGSGRCDRTGVNLRTLRRERRTT